MRYRKVWPFVLASLILIVAVGVMLHAPDRTRGDSAQPAVGCATTSSVFLKDVCARLAAAGTWQDASVATMRIGPTPEMYARLAVAVRAGDEAVCDDPTTVSFIQAGAHLDASGAVAMCRSYVTQALKDGSFSVPDPATGESITVGVQP